LADALLPLPPLDSQIAEFVARIRADSARHPPRESVPIAQAREIAETVRRPWAVGGPAVAEIREHMVPTRHGPIRIRVYHPDGIKPKPAFIYLHGGGWVLFSLDTHDRLMREYAMRGDVAVVGIDYTRAPEGKFPQPIEETVDVVHWLVREGAVLGLDTTRLAIGGDSAGANLSVATALTLRDAGETPLRGLVLNYGSYDMDMFAQSVARYGNGDFGLSTHMMVWFRWHYLRSVEDANNPLASPLRANLKGLPPAFMVITELDVLYDNNIKMAEALRGAGVAVEANVYPGTVHSFLEAVSIADVSDRALQETAVWLQRLLAV
jgi:acetyl esterase